MHISPFQPLIPRSNAAAAVVTCPTYDALSPSDIRTMLMENPHSFMSVLRPDVLNPHLPPSHPTHNQCAAASLSTLSQNGMLVREQNPTLYVYELHTCTHVQRGIVASLPLTDYVHHNRIRRHELTRPDKEAMCTKLTMALNAHTAPVLLTYTAVDTITHLIDTIAATQPPTFQLTSEDAVTHTVYRIPTQHINTLVRTFAQSVPHAYIADGHHRIATAANIAHMRNNLKHAYFPAVLFPHTHLRTVSYNRVVRTLGDQTTADFLTRLRANTHAVTRMPHAPKQPPRHTGTIYMHVDRHWYTVGLLPTAADETPAAAAAAASEKHSDASISSMLDVSLLQQTVLAPALDIHNARDDPRLHFVSGDAPLTTLLNPMDMEPSGVAFILRPLSVHDIMRVADHDQVMPPKSTCFEPKLRCGFFVHTM